MPRWWVPQPHNRDGIAEDSLGQPAVGILCERTGGERVHTDPRSGRELGRVKNCATAQPQDTDSRVQLRVRSSALGTIAEEASTVFVCR
ncbi:hypothetical protein CDEST_13962 [Colletotrichum destructivum]|uniref:Uncharacterized protein n=1 Tax=Colletotrichum destructivum TaxID=34406 RepID=A0AAX4J077_9PEZI|nr:hypothetical protein CDEST_13962 [Colletotrichum destructivum]